MLKRHPLYYKLITINEKDNSCNTKFLYEPVNMITPAEREEVLEGDGVGIYAAFSIEHVNLHREG